MIAEGLQVVLHKWSNLDSYTLTTAEGYQVGALCTSILSAISLFGIIFLRKDVKRFAWLISTINAGAMTLFGAFFLAHQLKKHPTFFMLDMNDTAKLFHDNSDFTVLVSIWFGVVNVFDLAVGAVFYPKYLGLLTAWVHHTAFIFIMYFSTTGDGLFFKVSPFSHTLLFGAVEELPTFLLAFGSMFGQFRTDLGFGLTFFVLRILYHAYLFYYGVQLGIEAPLIAVYTLTMSMHLNWFYAWVSKYGVKKTDKKKAV